MQFCYMLLRSEGFLHNTTEYKAVIAGPELALQIRITNLKPLVFVTLNQTIVR